MTELECLADRINGFQEQWLKLPKEEQTRDTFLFYGEEIIRLIMFGVIAKCGRNPNIILGEILNAFTLTIHGKRSHLFALPSDEIHAARDDSKHLTTKAYAAAILKYTNATKGGKQDDHADDIATALGKAGFRSPGRRAPYTGSSVIKWRAAGEKGSANRTPALRFLASVYQSTLMHLRKEGRPASEVLDDLTTLYAMFPNFEETSH